MVNANTVTAEDTVCKLTVFSVQGAQNLWYSTLSPHCRCENVLFTKLVSCWGKGNHSYYMKNVRERLKWVPYWNIIQIMFSKAISWKRYFKARGNTTNIYLCCVTSDDGKRAAPWLYANQLTSCCTLFFHSSHSSALNAAMMPFFPPEMNHEETRFYIQKARCCHGDVQYTV